MMMLMLPTTSSALEEDGVIKASTLIDRELYDAKGNEIGEVDDLVIRRNGKIKKVILGVGGFLGIGEKSVGFPFRKLKLEQDKIVVDVTKEQLEDMPDFDYRHNKLYSDYYYRPIIITITVITIPTL